MANGSMDVSDAQITRAQRTDEGKNYESMRAALTERLRKDKSFREERTEELRGLRTVTPGQVHSNAFMANLSKQYKNDEYIGEQVMPVVSSDKMSNVFPTYDKRERLNVPDDAMGSRSEANELNESRGSDSFMLLPYGLKNSVPAATIANEDPSFDEMFDLTEALFEGCALKREMRIASAVTTAANYAGNTATLSGTDQWDSGAGGDPIGKILAGVAASWTGFGASELVGVTSIDVWNVLCKHQSFLDIFKYTAAGLTKMDLVAREFGLDRILVGKARKDTANTGQTAAYSRIWGKDFAIVRVAKRASLRNAAFGYTIRFSDDPTTTQWFDPTKGLHGSYFAQSGSHEVQKVVAGDAGYLYKSVVS